MQAILALIPWNALLGLATKLILMFLEKNEEHKDAKRQFLIFIDSISKDVPVRVRSKYKKQIEDLKEQLRQEKIHAMNLEKSHETYKNAYEGLTGNNH